MQILIMRHGSARPVSAEHDDATRPLTDLGVSEATKCSRYLASQGTKLSELRSSPYVRAQQTASILASELNIPRIETDPDLTPHGSVDDILISLFATELPAVGLISHQPLVGLFLGKLLAQDPDEFMISPATFALLECTLSETKVKNAKLLALVQPWEIKT